MSFTRKLSRGKKPKRADRRLQYEAIVSGLRPTAALVEAARDNPARLKGRLEGLFKSGMTLSQSRAEYAAIATDSEWKELWSEWRAEGTKRSA